MQQHSSSSAAAKLAETVAVQVAQTTAGIPPAQSGPDCTGVTAFPTSGRAVVSVDVFDTVLTRVWLYPSDVFLHTGCRLIEEGIIALVPEDWAVRRRRAERDLRAMAAGGELSLDRIYHALARAGVFSLEKLHAAIQVEVECERLASRPLELKADHVRTELRRGRRVLFVSDFYLGRHFVVDLLHRAGIAARSEDVFVSSEEGVTKASGALFRRVVERTRIAASGIYHTGDNPYADVRQARGAGLHAAHFEAAMPTPLERRLRDAGGGCDAQLRASVVAGAARRARLSRTQPDSHRSAIWDVATNVAGPLLTGFVLWTLQAARRLGLRRLHYLSRDGQILVRIADVLAPRFAPEVEARYLYASRSALFLPAAAAGTREDRAMAVVGTDPGASVAGVFGRLGLDPAFARTELASAGLPEPLWQKRLTGAREIARLRQALAKPDVACRIEAIAQRERELAVAYLRKHDVLSADRFAVVDIGWKGRLQRALAALAGGQVTGAKPVGLYFGLYAHPPADAGAWFAFCDAKTDLNLAAPNLVEVFAAADHGSVRRYAEAPGGTSQVELIVPSNAAAIQWGLQTLQDGIIEFTRRFVDGMDLMSDAPELWVDRLRASSLAALRQFMMQPSRPAAEAFGAFPHASDNTHSTHTELAPRSDWWTAMSAAVTARVISRQSYWPEGTIVRSVPGLASRTILASRSLRARLREVHEGSGTCAT